MEHFQKTAQRAEGVLFTHKKNTSWPKPISFGNPSESLSLCCCVRGAGFLHTATELMLLLILWWKYSRSYLGKIKKINKYWHGKASGAPQCCVFSPIMLTSPSQYCFPSWILPQDFSPTAVIQPGKFIVVITSTNLWHDKQVPLRSQEPIAALQSPFPQS